MALITLQSSGPISLSQIQTEFGGSNPISISEYYRGGSRVQDNYASAGIPTTGQISFSNFYSKGKVFLHTITSNIGNLNLYNYLLTQGWDGVGFVEVTINAGVWIYSDVANGPGLTIENFTAEGLNLFNYGYIIGQGGSGGDANDSRIPSFNKNGGAGSAAIRNTSANVTIYNYSGAYIAGGGGGGGGAVGGDRGKGGGGGGAGGGSGGRGLSTANTVLQGGAGGGLGASGSDSPTNGNNTGGRGGQAGGSGSGTNGNDGADNDSGSGGGGGGRVLPGTTGVDARLPTGFGYDYTGGFGGAAGQTGGRYGRPYWQDPFYEAGSDPCRNEGMTTPQGYTAGGGGGWGAAGGAGDTARGGGSGGAAGAAISSTQAYTLSNAGVIRGAT